YVADLADGRHALAADHPHLTGRHAQRDVVAFLRDDLDTGARRPRHLAAPAGYQLDVVHRRAERDLRQRQRVPGTDVRTRAGLDRLPDLDPRRVEDVPSLPVLELDQRDVGAPVGIVLDRDDLGRRAEPAPAEVDDPVLALVPPTAPGHGH